MKRDNDLIRDILLNIEEADDCMRLGQLEQLDISRDALIYHLKLLVDAGYIDAKFMFGDDTVIEVFINRLTWEGHEFLDAIRDDTVWSQTKSKVSAAVGSASLDIIKAVATAVITARLGLS